MNKLKEKEKVPKLVTIQEAAAVLTLSPWTIRNWIAKGTVSHIRLGRRIAVPLSEVERLVREGTVDRAKPTEKS